MNEDINGLISELKRFEFPEFDGKDYAFVRKQADNVINSLILKEEVALDYLYPFLENPETWTCLFAIEIMGKIKSEKSVKKLVDFIVFYENTDYFDRCDEALQALVNIGKPSAKEIINALSDSLEREHYIDYLDEALGKIDDAEGRVFRLGILKDYIANSKKYNGWFNLTLFAAGFSENDKEALPYLKQLLKLRLTREEKSEISSAIEAIESPEEYHKKLEKDAKKLKPLFEQMFKPKIGRNNLCPCGSGKKYKKCCLDKDLEN